MSIRWPIRELLTIELLGRKVLVSVGYSREKRSRTESGARTRASACITALCTREAVLIVFVPLGKRVSKAG